MMLSDLPLADRLPSMHDTTRPISRALANAPDVHPELRRAVAELEASPYTVTAIEAAGYALRGWRPTRPTLLAESAAMLAGDRRATLAGRLGAAVRAYDLQRAEESAVYDAEALAEVLWAIEVATQERPPLCRSIVRSLVAQRDALQSVLVALQLAGRGDDLEVALLALDEEAFRRGSQLAPHLDDARYLLPPLTTRGCEPLTCWWRGL